MKGAIKSPSFVLVGGGARSGKSAFAMDRALDMGERRIFIATAQALDEEMLHRIEKHRAERRGRFKTLEVPLELPEALESIEACDVVLVDCLTLWVSNLMWDQEGNLQPPEHIEERIRHLSESIARRRCHIILVSNEVGLGVVPEHPTARLFRDYVGKAHSTLANLADEVYFAVFGCVLGLKPELSVVRPIGPDIDSRSAMSST